MKKIFRGIAIILAVLMTMMCCSWGNIVHSDNCAGEEIYYEVANTIATEMETSTSNIKTSTEATTTTTKGTTTETTTTSSWVITEVVTTVATMTITTTTTLMTTISLIKENVVIENEAGEYVKTFSRGTYYKASKYNAVGGSGRTLQNGYSIASRYLYEKYSYTNPETGQPWKFYLSSQSHPEINGIYQLDDCSAPRNNEVVDIYYNDYSLTPNWFRMCGVIGDLEVYIIK